MAPNPIKERDMPRMRGDAWLLFGGAELGRKKKKTGEYESETRNLW